MSAPRRPAATIGAGLEPLAVLPVFLDLRGKRAVVAGGDAGALWKARLLSAAGASVDVFAEAFDAELRPEPVAGPIRLHARGWRPDDLDGAAFAIAGVAERADASAFVAASRARGVLVNAVDRPALCDVQFGAIVNRSPLVVGISTDGAAPILAQRVRSEVEGLLPRGLGAWLEVAARWRERIAHALAPGPARRSFWEGFCDRAFRDPDRPPGDDDLQALVEDGGRASPATGSVALVGAGPGDPELLTLKAVRALRSADVVLYDDLVGADVLGFVRREAKTMLVGKTGHGPSCRQDEINDLMVRLARQGRRVVRLKGGDPMIFARAAEELGACRAAGLAVEIVPGISAAQGAAAELGTPLTHRDGARRVQYVTAHDRKGKLPALDWNAIADPTATTAIYMPRRRLAELLTRALAAGLPPATPAAAIVNATRPDREIVRGTVGELPERLAGLDMRGPMVVLIGEAIRASGRVAEAAADATRSAAR